MASPKQIAAVVLITQLFALGAHAEEPAAPAPAAALDLAAARQARADRFVWHRVSGAISAGLHVAALTFFVLDDVDRFGGGARTQSFKTAELAAASLAQVGMVSTYLIGATAPPRESTPTVNVVHQALVFGAGALNLARIIFCALLMGYTDASAPSGLVTLHRVTAIAAPVLLAGGIAVQLF